MGIFTGIVAFILLWWVVFFTVLPLGVTSQAKAGEVTPGTEPGAPSDPRMWAKVRLTFMIAAGLWLLLFLTVHFKVIDVDAIMEGVDESR